MPKTGCVICTVNVVIANEDGLKVKVCSMFGTDNKCIQKFCQEI